QHTRVARLAFPDEGGLVAARPLDVPVEAVVRDIELSADEPFRVGKLPLLRLLPRLHPSELFGLLFPEPDRVGLGVLVDRRALDARRLGEVLWRRKLPSLFQECLDGLVALTGLRHGLPSRFERFVRIPSRETMMPRETIIRMRDRRRQTLRAPWARCFLQ